jgi:hypothetical protein
MAPMLLTMELFEKKNFKKRSKIFQNYSEALYLGQQGSRWRAIRAKKSPCEGRLRFLVG